jgi:hypothetical protein
VRFSLAWRLKVVRDVLEGLEDGQVFASVEDEHGVGWQIHTDHCDSLLRPAGHDAEGPLASPVAGGPPVLSVRRITWRRTAVRAPAAG